MPGTVAAMDRPAPSDVVTSSEVTIDGFEQLRAATPTTRAEIIQIEAGRMQGRLKHAGVGSLSLGLGSFSRGLISRGVYSDERVTIGFLFNSGGPGSRRAGAAGIRIWSPGAEHERRHYAGASFGAVALPVDDLVQFFGPRSRFGDPAAWLNNNSFQTAAGGGSTSAFALRSIMAGFDRHAGKLKSSEAEYWKKAIIESVCYAVSNSERSDLFVSSPRRLVRRAEEYLDSVGSAPVHISALTTALGVSHRSLYRAFDEVLGIAPIVYLRHKRLCEARILLQQSASPETVADVAFRQGFSDFGRFAGYYRKLFGEGPSATLKWSRRRE
ncbi:helix-turn-helix domain-containing protein [Bradyrhizobium sp. U531]|uniref:AraC family transcriptional regulator n=1 Tax=Bradyrhizobium sp. U531 TaxID=3053458 RepID=UPI003F4300F8